MALILRDKKNTWENGIIPYEIKNKDFNNTTLSSINRAIAHWNTSTNWKIIPRNGQEDYVEFILGERNWSAVGRQGKKQNIILFQDSHSETVIHEIGHCVGFKHEHTRNDRDNYVIVMEDRAIPLKAGNFKKVSLEKYRDYGDYDYESIMHYPKSSFRKTKTMNLGRGWALSEFYHTNEGLNLFLINKQGNIRIYRMNTNFLGRELERYQWTEDWTAVKFYKINGGTYQFLLKEKGDSSSGHNVIIHKINEDGSIGERIERLNYSEGWTSVEFYKINGQTYRLMSKKKGFSSFNKNFHIDKMRSNGTVGSKVEYYKWTEGWTNVKFFEINGKLRLFLLKKLKDGVKVLKMKNNGEVGKDFVVQPGINIYAPEPKPVFDSNNREILIPYDQMRINTMGTHKVLSPLDIAAANSLI